MGGLEGKTIAIGGERKFGEIALLIEKRGGLPMSRPVQGTLTADMEAAEADAKSVLSAPPDWLVFTTGVGAAMLLDAAEAIGRKEELVECMSRIKLCARGYKTAKVLRNLGLEPTVTDDDGTTAGLIHGLRRFDMAGREVMVQYYGDRPIALAAYLDGSGARVRESYPYRYQPPEDAVLERLLQEVIAEDVQAVMLTSALQAHNVFRYAARRGLLEPVAAAFNNGCMAAAVGKVTAEAYREYGVRHVVAPEHERIGSMVVAMEEAFAAQSRN